MPAMYGIQLIICTASQLVKWMVGSGSQYKCLCRFRIPAKATGTCVLIFLTSVLCIVDFMTIKLFDLKFYFDGFNALVFCTYNLQHNTHLGQCP